MVASMDRQAYRHTLRMMEPPRPVPVSSIAAIALNAFVQIGCFVLLFSTPFFWIFVGNAELPGIGFRGETMRTNGVVTEVEDTNASENDRSIWGVHYRYSVNARAYEGVSYESGGTDLEPGSLVIVEYLRSDPATSRVEGLRRGMFGPGVLFVLIFPAIGLALTLGAFVWGLRRATLLVHGIAVFAKYRETRTTNTRVNNRPVYEVIHEYRTLDGELRESSTRTTDVDPITDESEELILYHPSRPDRAVPVDDIRQLPDLDEAGGFRGNLRGALLRLILPATVVLVNGYWLLRKLG